MLPIAILRHPLSKLLKFFTSFILHLSQLISSLTFVFNLKLTQPMCGFRYNNPALLIVTFSANPFSSLNFICLLNFKPVKDDNVFECRTNEFIGLFNYNIKYIYEDCLIYVNDDGRGFEPCIHLQSSIPRPL